MSARSEPQRERERVAVVGAGLVGRAWAIVFARAGHPVRLHDAQPEAALAALQFIEARLHDLQGFGLLAEAPAAVLARIVPEPSLEAAVAGVALVQENIRETVEDKAALFQRLDALAPPEAVLASSTSWLPASRFTAGLPGRERCLVAHPTNPPYLVPLVELCPAPWTSEAALARAHALYAAAGQQPIRVEREIHGFLLNRVQGAVLDECLTLYEEGLASAEDIDKVLKDGLALRWSFMGPFETIDLNAPGGVLDYARRYGASNRELAAGRRTFGWNEETLQRLDAERRARLPLAAIDECSAWRDRRLMALAAHKQAAEAHPFVPPPTDPESA